MTIQPIRSLYNARPFRPFTLHLTDGRSFFVQHPEHIASSSSGRTVAVYQPDDTSQIIDIQFVADVEVEPTLRGSKKPRRR